MNCLEKPAKLEAVPITLVSNNHDLRVIAEFHTIPRGRSHLRQFILLALLRLQPPLILFPTHSILAMLKEHLGQTHVGIPMVMS